MPRLFKLSRLLPPVHAIPLLACVCALVLVIRDPSFASEPFDAAEQARIDCLDVACAGDIAPAAPGPGEAVFKLGGHWFAGPVAHFGHGAADVRLVAAGGVPVSMQLRTGWQPPAGSGSGWSRIAQAVSTGGIASLHAPRADLEIIRLKSGPQEAADTSTYYVSGQGRDAKGLPVVASCNHALPQNAGGSLFEWQPGIWVAVRLNQQHCARWPEIHGEITRLLDRLRPVEI